MSEWCQNKDCCHKKNQNQIRGTKGYKYYQSNKAYDYYFGMFCSQGCFHNYFREHSRRILDIIGEIPKQTIGVDDAWRIGHDYNYGDRINSNSHHIYFLENKLMGIKQEISREQAQTPEQLREDYGFRSEWNSGGSNSYFLINLLMGVKHRITREQAQTPEDIRENYDWGTRPGSEAKPLAIQLGLAS